MRGSESDDMILDRQWQSSPSCFTGHFIAAMHYPPHSNYRPQFSINYRWRYASNKGQSLRKKRRCWYLDVNPRSQYLTSIRGTYEAFTAEQYQGTSRNTPSATLIGCKSRPLADR